MLRRLINVAILLLSVAVAGMPAAACAADGPMRDCCPSTPKTPCGDSGFNRATLDRLQVHCEQAVTFSTGCAVTDSRHGLLQRSLPPDLSATPVSFAATAAYRLFSREPVDDHGPPSFFPAFSLLYLSTGRLRL